MGFVACSAFSWEDNRITDEELNELIKEFVLYENSSLAEKFSGNGNNEESCEDSVNDTINNDGFMVVNCLESSKKSIENWEEVINRPDFHVWRRPVNNSSLYQYKGKLCRFFCKLFLNSKFTVYGSYTDISAFSFYSVVRDLDYRKEWDKLVLKLEIVETEPKAICAKVSPEVDDSGNELIYWVMKYPVRVVVETKRAYLVILVLILAVSDEEPRICIFAPISGRLSKQVHHPTISFSSLSEASGNAR